MHESREEMVNICPSLSYYLPIAGGVLVQCEMQSVSSRIWTRIAVFISYGDNDYTTGTSDTEGKTSTLIKIPLAEIVCLVLNGSRAEEFCQINFICIL